MPGPHDFAVRVCAVRLRAVLSLTSDLALRSPCAPTLPRPPHPVPTSVTIREAPLMRDGMARRNHVFLKNRSDLFFARGLDRNSRTLPVGQITLHRNAARGGARRANGRPLREHRSPSAARVPTCLWQLPELSAAVPSHIWRNEIRRAKAAGISDRRHWCGGSEVPFIVALHCCREFFTRTSKPNHTGAHDLQQTLITRGQPKQSG
jgi:hypothetical protein